MDQTPDGSNPSGAQAQGSATGSSRGFAQSTATSASPGGDHPSTPGGAVDPTATEHAAGEVAQVPPRSSGLMRWVATGAALFFMAKLGMRNVKVLKEFVKRYGGKNRP